MKNWITCFFILSSFSVKRWIFSLRQVFLRCSSFLLFFKNKIWIGFLKSTNCFFSLFKIISKQFNVFVKVLESYSAKKDFEQWLCFSFGNSFNRHFYKYFWSKFCTIETFTRNHFLILSSISFCNCSRMNLSCE